MTTTRCIHGLDSRFCAVCNRKSRPTAPSPAATGTSLAEILTFLNDASTRATYGAVATLLGVPPRSMGAVLGARRPEASWIINADTGLPTDYEPSDWHPDLLASGDVIRTGHELTLRLTLWRTTRT
jgi:alkylated DNA nucleotide flippase Atl1